MLDPSTRPPLSIGMEDGVHTRARADTRPPVCACACVCAHAAEGGRVDGSQKIQANQTLATSTLRWTRVDDGGRRRRQDRLSRRSYAWKVGARPCRVASRHRGDCWEFQKGKSSSRPSSVSKGAPSAEIGPFSAFWELVATTALGLRLKPRRRFPLVCR